MEGGCKKGKRELGRARNLGGVGTHREEWGAWEEKGVQLPGEAESRMLQVYTPLPGRSMPRCHGNLPGQPPGGCQAPPTLTSGVYADRAAGPV